MKKILAVTTLGCACCAGSAAAFIKTCVDYFSVPEAGYIGDLTRDALKMKNNSHSEIKYFYSNLTNDGQDRWCLHYIDSLSSSSWDWTWIYATTADHIEFMLHKSGSNKYHWITIVFNHKVEYSYQFNEGIYWTTTQSETNPRWSLINWERHEANVGVYYRYNLHTNIEFTDGNQNNEFEINWEGFHFSF